jgi:hypothetical protein
MSAHETIDNPFIQYPRHCRVLDDKLMRLDIHISITLSLLASYVTALTLLDKVILLKSTPRCSVQCNAKAAKSTGVSYLDGPGNCARPQFQDKWRHCVMKKCSKDNTRKVS